VTNGPQTAPSKSGHFDPAGLTLLALVWRWRVFIIVNALIVMVVAALVTLTMKNVYRAHASILPPQGEGGGLAAQALDVLGGIGPVGYAAMGMSGSTGDLLVTVLRSRRLADMVVAAEGLQEYYGTATPAQARRRFDNVFSVSVDADGLVNIYVADRDPERAADIANTAVDALDSINVSVAVGAATATRKFVEDRLTEVQQQLNDAENELRNFQESKGTIALEEQLRVMIQSLAVLRVERMKEEMNLAILTQRLEPDHRRIQSVKERISTIDRQISAAESTGDSAATLTAGNAPELSLQSLRLMRKVTVYEQVYQYLRQRLEQAKIDERRDLPTFTVLDVAVPPDQKWRPLRAFIVLGSGLTAVALTILFVVWSESTRERRDMTRLGYLGGWRRLAHRERPMP